MRVNYTMQPSEEADDEDEPDANETSPIPEDSSLEDNKESQHLPPAEQLNEPEQSKGPEQPTVQQHWSEDCDQPTLLDHEPELQGHAVKPLTEDPPPELEHQPDPNLPKDSVGLVQPVEQPLMEPEEQSLEQEQLSSEDQDPPGGGGTLEPSEPAEKDSPEPENVGDTQGEQLECKVNHPEMVHKESVESELQDPMDQLPDTSVPSEPAEKDSPEPENVDETHQGEQLECNVDHPEMVHKESVEPELQDPTDHLPDTTVPSEPAEKDMDETHQGEQQSECNVDHFEMVNKQPAEPELEDPVDQLPDSTVSSEPAEKDAPELEHVDGAHQVEHQSEYSVDHSEMVNKEPAEPELQDPMDQPPELEHQLNPVLPGEPFALSDSGLLDPELEDSESVDPLQLGQSPDLPAEQSSQSEEQPQQTNLLLPPEQQLVDGELVYPVAIKIEREDVEENTFEFCSLEAPVLVENIKIEHNELGEAMVLGPGLVDEDELEAPPAVDMLASNPWLGERQPENGYVDPLAMSSPERRPGLAPPGEVSRGKVCVVCHQTFCSNYSLRRHEKRAHRQTAGSAVAGRDRATATSRPSFTCDVCGKSFKIESHLRLHRKWKHIDLQPHYPCSSCSKTFLEEEHLEQHREIAHSACLIGYLHCPYCSERFQHGCCFRYHISTAHSSYLLEQDPQCEPCQHQRDRSPTPADVTLVALRDDAKLRRLPVVLLERDVRLDQLLATLPVAKPGPALCNGSPNKSSGSSDAEWRSPVLEPARPEVHTCALCGEMYGSLASLIQHEDVVHGVARLDNFCPFCRTNFKSTEALHNHVRVSHTQMLPPRFACRYCLERFTTKPTLVTHLRNIHARDPQPCTFCGEMMSLHLLGEHVKELHKPSHELQSLVCRYCRDSFTSRIAVMLHEYGAHQSAFTAGLQPAAEVAEQANLLLAATFPCTYCQLSFPREESRLKHERTAHFNGEASVEDLLPESPISDYQPESPVSDYQPESPAGDDSHVEMLPEEFACRYCSLTFRLNTNRLKHEHLIHAVVHGDEEEVDIKPFLPTPESLEDPFSGELSPQENPCGRIRIVNTYSMDVAEKPRASSQQPASRKKPRVRGSLKCPHCSRWLTNRSSLQRHVGAWHTRTTQRSSNFVCRACPERFKLESSLRRHERWQHNLEPVRFQCVHCTHASFGTKAELHEHLVTKHVLVCDKCDVSFKDRDVMAKHQCGSPQSPDEDPKGQQGKKKAEGPPTVTYKTAARGKLTTPSVSAVAMGAQTLRRLPASPSKPSTSPSKLSACDVPSSKLLIYACAVCNNPLSEQGDNEEEKLCSQCNIISKPAYQCADCGKVMVSTATWEAHAPLPPTKINCPHCPQVLRHKSCLLFHISTSHGGCFNALHYLKFKDPKSFPCQACDTAYSTMRQFLEHVDSLHCPKKVVCPHCKALMGSQSLLGLELTEAPCKQCKTTVQPVIECAECEMRHTSVTAWLDHVREASKGPSSCSHCPRTFSRKMCLWHHSVMQHRFSHDCTKCGADFISARALEEHFAIYHTSSTLAKHLLCDLCGKSFTQRRMLVRHVQRHMSRESSLLQCALCSRKLFSENRLRSHLAWHERVGKRFACTRCVKTFATEKRLSTHLFKTHFSPLKDVKSDKATLLLKCQHCDKKFKIRNRLNSHVQRFHSQIHIEEPKEGEFSIELQIYDDAGAEISLTEPVAVDPASSQSKFEVEVKSGEETDTQKLIEELPTCTSLLKGSEGYTLRLKSNSESPRLPIPKLSPEKAQPLITSLSELQNFETVQETREDGTVLSADLPSEDVDLSLYSSLSSYFEQAEFSADSVENPTPQVDPPVISLAASEGTPLSNLQFPLELNFINGELEPTDLMAVLNKAASEAHGRTAVTVATPSKPDPPLPLYREQRTFTCDFCTKSYRHEGFLAKHIRTVHHKTQQTFACNLCEQTFDKQLWLNQHMKNVHGPGVAGNKKKKSAVASKITAKSPVAENKVLKDVPVPSLQLPARIPDEMLFNPEEYVPTSLPFPDIESEDVDVERDEPPVPQIPPATIIEKSLSIKLKIKNGKIAEIPGDPETEEEPPVKKRKVMKGKSPDSSEKSPHKLKKKKKKVELKKEELSPELNIPPKPTRIPCLSCDTYFSTPQELELHIQMVHDAVPAQCCMCAAVLRNQYWLTCHVKRIHHKAAGCVESAAPPPVSDDPPVSCPICTKVLRPHALKAHLAMVHPEGTKPAEEAAPKVPPLRCYACKQCDKKFLAQEMLRAHVEKAHVEVKPPVEPVKVEKQAAASRASRPAGLSSLVEAGRNLPCPHCDEMLGNQRALDGHMKKRHRGVTLPA